MTGEIKQHYLQTGTYTYAGPYAEHFKSLPEDIRELGNLICGQIIHRITLREGNTNANADLRYGDMTRFPWYRMCCEDDIFLTSVAMCGELFRLDPRGIVADRAVEHKLVISCRYAAVLTASILKAKGIPARCRAGFAPYFTSGISADHWITQYWSDAEQRWITIDTDAFFLEGEVPFDQYDMPLSCFDFAGPSWLAVRNGKEDGKRFVYADGLGTNSLKAILRYLFYDFFALMNHELTFSFQPSLVDHFDELTEKDFMEFDKLAELLCEPDRNFTDLKYIWENNRTYRTLTSPLVGDWDNAGCSI